jgi:hypothetical protein
VTAGTLDTTAVLFHRRRAILRRQRASRITAGFQRALRLGRRAGAPSVPGRPRKDADEDTPVTALAYAGMRAHSLLVLLLLSAALPTLGRELQLQLLGQLTRVLMQSLCPHGAGRHELAPGLRSTVCLAAG